ncbi:helix-turn-helix domain-containing protein [Bacillus sp. FJAT-49736]|uniref:helix-turn-helix domain-containing protein n=1 Tax=Bacillus sp. FJAT-49736 TaxID=2833582 RepID=UPI001BCA164C|nr:helix-turn-helix domain-containing protein [Bacillus sp. FJAT-49736]MBS4171812.1 hypothetical protein [Bacillus sp. FJAT-49736]
MREYNVHEVLAILQKYYITDSQQMVTRWIREGKIRAVRTDNRKDGYRVAEDDLFDFIEEQRPGLEMVMNGYYDHYIKDVRLNLFKEENSPVLLDKDDEDEDEDEQASNEEKDTELNDVKSKITELENKFNILQKSLNKVIEQNKQVLAKNDHHLVDKEMLNQLNDKIDRITEQINYKIDGITEQLNDKMEEFKEQIKNTKVNSTSSQKEVNINLTYDEFKDLSKDILSELDFQVEENKKEEHLSLVYKHIAVDNKIKEEFLSDDGTFFITPKNNEYKQPKRFMKDVIQYYLENLQPQT